MLCILKCTTGKAHCEPQVHKTSWKSVTSSHSSSLKGEHISTVSYDQLDKDILHHDVVQVEIKWHKNRLKTKPCHTGSHRKHET